MRRAEGSLACGSSSSTLFETDEYCLLLCVIVQLTLHGACEGFPVSTSQLTSLCECWDYRPHHCAQFYRDSRDLNSGHGACVTNTWSTVQSPQFHVSFLSLLICHLWNEQLTISCYNLTTKWSHGCSRMCSPVSCICLKDKISICLIIIILVGVSNNHFKTMMLIWELVIDQFELQRQVIYWEMLIWYCCIALRPE